jgi:hypothetical protein
MNEPRMTSNKDFIGKFWGREVVVVNQGEGMKESKWILISKSKALGLFDDARSGGVAAAGNGKGPSLPVCRRLWVVQCCGLKAQTLDEPVLWVGRMTEAAGTYSKSIDRLIYSRCSCISAVVVRRGRSSPRPSNTPRRDFIQHSLDYQSQPFGLGN